MKPDQLMEAIENIDDRYIEECAYGVRRKSHIPWGMIITAACFCLAIGATIFMQSLGILPHLNGTEGTSQPVTSEPSMTTLPPETTLPQTNPTEPPQTAPPTFPPETRPSVEEFFSDRENWQNHLILPAFSDPTEIDLRPDYLRAMDGESTYATDLEHEKLSTVVRGYSRDKLFRATKAQLDEVMLALFNITTDQLTTDWESHFTYLAETDCYYGRANNAMGYTVYIGRTEECDDGTILMYYALASGEEPYMVAKLQPHETGYYILSNERYTDNTGKTEDQIAMEALFGDRNSWFNRAISCEYDSPKEMSLLRFFYSGIKGENQKTTDQERELLKEKGVNLNYDLMRLPVDKMNEVLTEYFGITLADMEPEAFSGLVYLESTNCYYHSTSGWMGVERFEALSVERMDDGRILVRYPYMKYEYVVTLKPHGDGYQILSNVLADGFRPYKVDAAQLNALLQEVANGNLTEQRKDEILLPLLGTFLEDSELFVDSLGKQQRSQTGVMHIFALRINYTHPRYAAYNQTIREMLPKVQLEEHKRTIYWMAFYSGLGNFLPQTPDAQDYALLFDMVLYSDGAFSEGCAEWFKRYCMAYPEAFTAAMSQTEEENWELYAHRVVTYATQEERKQIKESMKLLIEELSMLDGYGLYDQIQCAKLIIEKCDKIIGN